MRSFFATKTPFRLVGLLLETRESGYRFCAGNWENSQSKAILLDWVLKYFQYILTESYNLIQGEKVLVLNMIELLW